MGLVKQNMNRDGGSSKRVAFAKNAISLTGLLPSSFG